MNTQEINSWQDIQSVVLNRIRSRMWKPGELIPNEVELAREFGCARATVNRAMQAVADAGLIDRKRKAGTRVALHPERKAILSIPIIRKEIEARGKAYSHQVLYSATTLPPPEIAGQLNLKRNTEALELHTLHLADQKPYAYEERWINLQTLPVATGIDFTSISANEWLVMHAPFTHGELAFSAENVSPKQAKILGINRGDATFIAMRRTQHKEKGITVVKLMFAPGYRLQMAI